MIERKVEEAGIRAVVGGVLTGVAFDKRRVQHLEFAHRFGPLRIEAQGYVDASGDASLSYEAGLEVREPDASVYGSLNFVIEGYDVEAVKDLVIKDVTSESPHAARRTGSCGTMVLMHFPV